MIWSPLSQGVEQHYKLEAHNVIDKGESVIGNEQKKTFYPIFLGFAFVFQVYHLTCI